MARKRKLPSLDVQDEETIVAACVEFEEPTVTETPNVDVQVPQPEQIAVTIPVREGLGGYCKKRIDVTLTGRQAEMLKAVQLGLEAGEGKLDNGRWVQNPGDAMKWILENMTRNSGFRDG